MTINDPAPRRIPRRAALGLLDLAVMVEALLMFETADVLWTQELAERLARTGLVAAGASPGQLAAAVNDLNSSARYQLGEGGDDLPESMGHVGTHLLVMPSRGAAQNCQATIVAAGLTAIVRAAPGDGWEVEASGPELPPDPDFKARASQMEALAAEHGGRYAGSGRW